MQKKKGSTTIETIERGRGIKEQKQARKKERKKQTKKKQTKKERQKNFILKYCKKEKRK